MGVKLTHEVSVPLKINLAAYVVHPSTSAETKHLSEGASSQNNPNDMPVSGQTEQNTTYSLFAAIIHSGGTNSGHYYSMLRPGGSHKWFSFDDTFITEVDAQYVLAKSGGGAGTESAYMLFYVVRKAEYLQNIYALFGWYACSSVHDWDSRLVCPEMRCYSFPVWILGYAWLIRVKSFCAALHSCMLCARYVCMQVTCMQVTCVVRRHACMHVMSRVF
jgi:hypothetical protein